MTLHCRRGIVSLPPLLIAAVALAAIPMVAALVANPREQVNLPSRAQSGTAIGWHDTVVGGTTCTLSGWTCDPSKYSQALQVDVWVNDGAKYEFVGSALPNQSYSK